MTYDIAVVGGGIVGLATLRELGLRFPALRLALIEKEARLSAHQSGHNSGVVHSGIYYAPGSHKARLCIDGRRRLLAYCDEKSIGYRRTGKLIVATREAELARLDVLLQRGRANGVEGLDVLDGAAIAEREPHVCGIRAIAVPTTCIVDFARVATAYADDARNAGAAFYLGTEVRGIVRERGVTRLRTSRDEVAARAVVTCGGLFADRLAQMSGGGAEPRIVPFRGDYLKLKPARAGLVRGNIYPVPDPALPFLGVHFTPRMDGAVWLGPNAVLAFAREGYALRDVDPRELAGTLAYPGFRRLARRFWRTGAGELYRDVSRRAFVAALQRYVPELTVDDCIAGPSGVRAQALGRDGALVDDFVFDGAEGVLHVRNAPSPAATASLAIANYIADDATRRFSLT